MVRGRTMVNSRKSFGLKLMVEYINFNDSTIKVNDHFSLDLRKTRIIKVNGKLART